MGALSTLWITAPRIVLEVLAIRVSSPGGVLALDLLSRGRLVPGALLCLVARLALAPRGLEVGDEPVVAGALFGFVLEPPLIRLRSVVPLLLVPATLLLVPALGGLFTDLFQGVGERQEAGVLLDPGWLDEWASSRKRRPEAGWHWTSQVRT